MNTDPPTPETVHGALVMVAMSFGQIHQQMEGIRANLSTAYSLAVAEGRPTVQVRFLQSEVDALQGIVRELEADVTRLAAEVEAKSLG
jgi:hypothetical protein